ncbi:nuclease (plasmid) [Komagataeibacter nataicola]|uniref:Nuclease n=1 Tax=Komagataeibacter nataicola TaxID=265960 RepID=A0A9N7CU16_9PROT|nr:nuclease [Komagataeibacter nataicola]PYD64867.1 nuclease [Komagataeibacter nataicola]
MTPTRIRECLALLHWSQRELAKILNYGEGTVRGWCRGIQPIPQDAAAWLEMMAQHAEANPPPKRQHVAI